MTKKPEVRFFLFLPLSRRPAEAAAASATASDGERSRCAGAAMVVEVPVEGARRRREGVYQVLRLPQPISPGRAPLAGAERTISYTYLYYSYTAVQ